MAKLGFCAGLGVFCILSSVVLIIFAEISQTSSSSTVLRHLEMSTVDMTGFGPFLASQGVDTSGLYGSGTRDGTNTGLRQYYSWGIWNSCESNSQSGTDDAHCTGSSFGYRYVPIDAISADVPTNLQTAVANSLGNNYFTSNSSSSYTHAAFYLYFIGAIFAGISLVTSILAHRFAFLMSAVTGLLACFFIGTATAIWTAMIHKMRNAINDGHGVHVTYGNCLWISWAATLAALISVVPFLLSCCFGGRSSRNDWEDEKY